MTAPTSADTSPVVEEDHVLFRFPDPDHRLESVALHQELVRPRNGPALGRLGGAWQARFPRMPVARMEYQFELQHTDGGSEMVCDPSNPKRAPGPFGDKSVVEFPGYEEPSWLGRGDGGRVEAFGVRSRPLRARLPVELWGPADAESDEPLPLLVAHDGPEYGRYSALTEFLWAAIEDGLIPRMRAALVGPVERNLSLSASAAYTRSFAHEVLPAILQRSPTPHGRTMRAGMGASLGGLSMLHIHRRAPATFGALFLQSGSYFRQRYDKQESGFPKFRRISRFVGEVLTAEVAHPVPVTMTCGTVEENLANNRAVRDALAGQGYDVKLIENPDAHNWVGWRDTFAPHLSDLLGRLWG